MGDDGVGIKVVEELMKRRLPRYVDIVEGGTESFQLANFFSSYDAVIIIDAVKFGKKPGRVYRLSLDEAAKGRIASIHDIDVFTATKLLQIIARMPPIIVIGVEVKEIRENIGLSPEVASAVKKVTKKIRKLIAPSAGRRGRSRRKPIRRVRLPPT